MSIAHALAVRSDYSIGESTLQIKTTPEMGKGIIEQAKDMGYETIALVDTMSVSGMPELAYESKKQGIKSILGVMLRVYDDSKWRKPKKTDENPGPLKNPMHTLKAYVHTAEGLRQVYQLLTLANDTEHFYYNSRVSIDEVCTILKKGDVSISTGDFGGLLSHPEYRERAALLCNTFGKLWVEVQPIDSPLYDTLTLRAQTVCESLVGAHPLMTYPVMYGPEQAVSTEVLNAIANGDKMSDGWRNQPFTKDFTLMSPAVMIERTRKVIERGDVPKEFMKQAIFNIETFAGLDWFTFAKREPCMPVMSPDEFMSLLAECKKGWKNRFDKPVMGHMPTPEQLAGIYKERLAFELGVIQTMGFSGYFLLVQEIVLWSKENGIMVGPGRGSVGGSLIAYLMNITDVDPVRFDLLFERFINPSRVDLPDADLDFMSSRREDVLLHIESQYGTENVAAISSYSTLGPAAAMRDVSRVYGLDQFESAAAKQTEKEHGANIPLNDSADQVPDLAKFREKYPVIWEHACKLEGVKRHMGRHAAGVVVAGEPVVNRGVVETRGGSPVMNWDKYTIEDHGLIKMDILGVSTLDTLNLAKTYIKERHGVDVDYLRLPLEDKLMQDAFARGETVAVFQFEGGGMRKLIMELGEGGNLTFDDLVAATALFRPGPLEAGMCDDYTQIKQGKKQPYYEHPLVEASFKSTGGVMVYQEQIMQVVRDLANFTLAESDLVRKAIGKKDMGKMQSYKEAFVKGAVSNGMGEYQAEALWGKIEGFAAYSFNKSHSVAYTMISWWAMWVKVYYPAEFYAAAMSVVDKDDKLSSLMMDAKRSGIVVSPPDINLSTQRIEIRGDKDLIAPFQAVKGVSDKTAIAIVQLRAMAGGAFTGKANLEALVTHHKMGAKCNVGHRERLERVGAFQALDGGAAPLSEERLKDRLELMPGFTSDTVKATRAVNIDALAQTGIIRIHSDIRTCSACSLQPKPHVESRMGKNPKFMVVFDAPNWQEEKAGKMFAGDGADLFTAALKDVGLSPNDGFYTSLIRAAKNKGAKGLTTEQINGCSGFLDREIELLKPPIIIVMGSASAKYLLPTLKQNIGELVGKVVWDAKRDASILIGMNPAMIFFDPSKVSMLQTIAQKIVELAV